MAQYKEEKLAPNDKEIKKKYLAGSTYTPGKLRRTGGSQTPGHKKNAKTCQLTTIGGLPRKAFARARSRKYKQYEAYCEFFDKINGR